MTERESDIEALAHARLGTVLRGKYRLDRVLGIGGMAVVYKATHRNLAEFAVKMLHPQMSLSADVRSRFLREGYAANSLKHPGAVLVVDDDVAEDGAAFLVMELLDGVGCEELWDRDGGRLDLDATSAIVIQLLDVLAAAHVNGVVHRDIKPANLFLTRAGVVKVLDFGIARAREAIANGNHITQVGVTIGTPGFMAPEQAAGRVREIDGRTDLWAAGATFFSLMTGQLVHAGETAQELTILAATQPARSLSAAAAHVPREVTAIVDRALAFRREDRWPTAEAMRDALIAACPAAASAEVTVASLVSASARIPLSEAPTLPSGPPPPLASPDDARPERARPTDALTTAALMMSGPEPPPARSRRWAVAASVALAAAVVGGVIGVNERDRNRAEPRRVSAESKQEEPAVLAAPPAEAAAPVAKEEDAAPSEAAAVASVKPADAGAKRRGDGRTIRQTSDCDPNYTLDDQGQKHFKPECFLGHSR